MRQLGFVFDANKCVGCHACVVACAIENQLKAGFNWRQVYSFNPQNIDGIGHHHLSLACNHCQEAVCITQCPASAIRRNSDTGIVLIDTQKCMGCNYCTWVCPYDAPGFDSENGIMTKCTLCEHRISEGQEPACVSICPVDALNVNSFTEAPQQVDIAGFPPSQIKPSILIEPPKLLREKELEYEKPFSEELTKFYIQSAKPLQSKISLSKEWTLLVFSLITAMLGGIFSTVFFETLRLNPLFFFAGGFIAIVVSLLHLGKKGHAWRAILNFRRSWLSREIMFFLLFMITASLFFLFQETIGLAYAGLAFALATGFSIDRVYLVLAQKKEQHFHSAQVLLTILFLAFILNQLLFPAILCGTVKLILYFLRKLKQRFSFLMVVISVLRIVPGLVLPFYLMKTDYPGILICSILVGELIDRVEFYSELEILTPASHQQELLLIDLQKQSN